MDGAQPEFRRPDVFVQTCIHRTILRDQRGTGLIATTTAAFELLHPRGEGLEQDYLVLVVSHLRQLVIRDTVCALVRYRVEARSRRMYKWQSVISLDSLVVSVDVDHQVLIAGYNAASTHVRNDSFGLLAGL